MPTNHVSEIIKLAGPISPVEQPGPESWSAAESDLGLELPSDLKAIVTALGTGTFGIGLYLRNPVTSSEYIHFSKSALLSFQQVVADSEEASGIALYPKPGGLVSIGQIDRQAFLLRPDASGKKLSKLVWWDLDCDKARDLNVSITQFIHDLYLGRIAEDWAEKLRKYFWQDGTAAFYTAWRKRSP